MARTTEFNDIAEWLDFWLCNRLLPEQEQIILERYYHSFKYNFSQYIKKHYCSQVVEVEEYIHLKKNPRLLEIGCGCGTESLWFSLNNAQVTGIDLQDDRLKVANARLGYMQNHLQLYPQVEFLNMSAFDAPRLGLFDIVWMEQAYHHIEPRDDFILLLKKLLKKDGVIIISEANGSNPMLQYQLFRQRGFNTIKEYKDSNGVTHIYGNERICTASNLSKKLSKAGFSVNRVKHYRMFPNKKWADNLSCIEEMAPEILTPLYTHYNLVAEHLVEQR